MIIRKGDIFVAELLKENYQCMLKGLHPCLVVSNFKACSFSSLVQIIPISSKPKSQPTHIELNESYGLNHPSILLVEQLTTISINNLKYQIGKISYTKMLEVEKAVNMQLGFSNTIVNLKDLKEVNRMIENIEELDRYLESIEGHDIEILKEKELALKYLEKFLLNHDININLKQFYLKDYKTKGREVSVTGTGI